MERYVLLITVALLSLLQCGAAFAQDYPRRPIRLVVPFPPGGGLDVIGRIVATQVEIQLGQPIVVDNRGGANGVIGSELVARAAADGYTLLNSGGALLVGQLVNRNLPYDIDKDFTGITSLGRGTGYLLLVNAGSPLNTVSDLIALARKAQRPISYGSAGVGNPNHLASALLVARAGIEAMHVPYRGTAPSINALMGNEVQFVTSPPSAVMLQVKAGRLRVVAFTGVARFATLPNVPTVAESGVAGYKFNGGFVCWHAPAGTPASILRRLQAEVHKALQVARVSEAVGLGGYQPGGETSEEFSSFVRAEMEVLREAVSAAKLNRT